jgi:hypothetical protein
MADSRISSVEEGKELIKRSFPIQEYLPQDADTWEEKYVEFEETLR